MKTAVIRSSWMEGYGYRLDTKPYVGGALEAKVLLESLPLPKHFVRDLVSPEYGGIYFAGRESVQWVESPELGIPFLRGKDIQVADLSHSPFISKRQVATNPTFLLRKGMTLITRSGTIGKTAYVRAEMDGMATSDPLRIVPDPRKIQPGYLYAYLSSDFGVPLLASGAYGAIIQHIEPSDIASIPVPRLGDAFEHEIHTLVEQAAELRTSASVELRKVNDFLLRTLGAPPDLGLSRAGTLTSVVANGEMLQRRRFDPWFFNGRAVTVDRWVTTHKNGHWKLAEVAEVFGMSPFKRVYVNDGEQGIGFFGSADIFKLDRTPAAYISRAATKAVEDYVLSRGAVLLASYGQLNGIIGLPQLVDSALAGMAASNHVLRIVPRAGKILAGYLFAYLALDEIGYPLIARTATGDSIPEIWSTYLNGIPILKAPQKAMEAVDAQVVEAFEMRVRATKLETEARNRLEAALKQSAN